VYKQSLLYNSIDAIGKDCECVDSAILECTNFAAIWRFLMVNFVR